MNVTFACSKCDMTGRVELDADAHQMECPHCQAHWAIPQDALAGEAISRCLACPGRELFLRKDFPQRVGVSIVVFGFAASCVSWYFHQVYATFAILFATALVDVILYMLVGNVLECYRCGAQYRGLAALRQYQPFNLETYERHRQQQARLKSTKSIAPD